MLFLTESGQTLEFSIQLNLDKLLNSSQSMGAVFNPFFFKETKTQEGQAHWMSWEEGPDLLGQVLCTRGFSALTSLLGSASATARYAHRFFWSGLLIPPPHYPCSRHLLPPGSFAAQHDFRGPLWVRHPMWQCKNSHPGIKTTHTNGVQTPVFC